MSRKALAERSGLSLAEVIAIETRRVAPYDAELQFLAEAMGVSPGVFGLHASLPQQAPLLGPQQPAAA